MPRFRRLLCSCGAPLRPSGQRSCRACHAAWMREHRKTPEGEARRRANARSYLNSYVRRGKIARGPCEVCGAREVLALHEDLSRPLSARWLCRAHHRAELRARRAQQTNPADALRDLLVNEEYGLGLALGPDDENLLSSMRAVCNEPSA